VTDKEADGVATAVNAADDLLGAAEAAAAGVRFRLKSGTGRPCAAAFCKNRNQIKY
jgi:hypothetical protein